MVWLQSQKPSWPRCCCSLYNAVKDGNFPYLKKKKEEEYVYLS